MHATGVLGACARVVRRGRACCSAPHRAFGPTVAPGANPLAFARMRPVPTTGGARVRRVGVGNVYIKL